MLCALFMLLKNCFFITRIRRLKVSCPLFRHYGIFQMGSHFYPNFKGSYSASTASGLVFEVFAFFIPCSFNPKLIMLIVFIIPQHSSISLQHPYSSQHLSLSLILIAHVSVYLSLHRIIPSLSLSFLFQ